MLQNICRAFSKKPQPIKIVIRVVVKQSPLVSVRLPKKLKWYGFKCIIHSTSSIHVRSIHTEDSASQLQPSEIWAI